MTTAVTSVRELAERLWNGDASSGEVHPVHTTIPGGEEIAEGLLYFKGVASVNTIDTGDGLVMLDTGTKQEQKRIFELVRGWRAEAPLHSAVYSHHHVDHIFGVEPFDAEAVERRLPRPRVYAHRGVPAGFDRYLRTLGWNTAINIRQFALPGARFSWPEQYRYPDVTYEQSLTFRAGDLTFELHHARGETDDATWTWVPERKLLAPGDLFIWAVPNAGNPQKVQRYAGEWAAALRKMASLGAEVLLPGHGLPIWGAERIAAALSDTAEVLESLESQVVALMNTGTTLDRILHEVRVPERLLEKPYLKRRPAVHRAEHLAAVWRVVRG